MAKISNNIVNSATSNIASINLENAVDSKTESTASKLLNLFKKCKPNVRILLTHCEP